MSSIATLPNNDVIEIPLSKSKLSLLLAGSIGFVALGFWFVISPTTFADSFSLKQIAVIITGYAGILFFGTCAVAVFLKFKTNKPGFVIDKDGITDNSGAVAVGFIPWKDITGISTAAVASQSFIMIGVKNPEEYIRMQTNFLKKAALELNNRTYGTPVSISANGLKCSQMELYGLLTDKFKQYSPGK